MNLIITLAIPVILQNWWFPVGIFLVVSIVSYIIFRRKLNVLEHENAELELQVLERSELLSYAKLSEQRSRDEAVLADKNKSQLISKISHDIRTPMTTMLGMASLLNETELTAEQREYANSIIDSGDGLLTLINDILMNDILEYSKVESGKELELKEFELHTCIEEVLDIFALKTAGSVFDLLYDIDSNVPSHIIGDSQRLKQILMNLVENSIKFTTQGEIFIAAHFVEERKDNRIKLEFEVRDTGQGIPLFKKEQLAKELSQQGISFNAHNTAGVGLTICKKLIEFMGGSLQIESREHEGTTVRFTVLVRKGLQNSRTMLNSEIAGLEGKKVLIVDENPTVRHLLKQRLERWSLMVATASSGRQALDMLTQNQGFDLVINDMQMPVMNGIDLALAIKESHPSVPVLLMNKAGDESYRKHAGLFFSVFNKPLRQHIVNEHVLNALRHKSVQAVVVEQTDKPTLSADFAKKYPLRIILAEDNIMNQKLVGKILNKLGYEPYITSNGKEVLEEVSHNNYDLILMDVQMPEMDGLEATRMIRLCLTVQPIIIAMTANTLQGDREECLQAGMDDYIGKPVKLDELVHILEKWAIHSKQHY